MALTLGTNCGFVTTAPTTDPATGVTSILDGSSAVTKHISPAGATTVTEVGWWQASSGAYAANFEVGLYAADGATVPGEAGTLLYVSATNAKGTGTGGEWKRVTGLSWSISASTNYWIGVQIDAHTTSTNVARQISGGSGYDIKTSQTTLTDPYGGGALSDADGIFAFYAVYTAGLSGIALTGTVTSSITEADIVTGGKTIILTLTGDVWVVAAGGLFDAQRQNIIDGIDSDQAEANGWDAVVKAGIAVTDVVRTSDTVVTITLPAFASYDITATETITATVPGTALLLGTGAVASPTFTVSATGVGYAHFLSSTGVGR